MEAGKIFAQRIRALIEKNGKGAKKLAAEIGISPQALSDYRNGNREPGLYAASRIADYFGVSIDYLVGRNECATPENEEIRKRLGLSDGAIDALKAIVCGGDTDQASFPSLISAMLDTDAGMEFLRRISIYAFVDFSKVYTPQAPDGADKVLFEAGKLVLGSDASYVIDAADFGDAFLLKASSALKVFRDVVQAGKYGAENSFPHGVEWEE